MMFPALLGAWVYAALPVQVQSEACPSGREVEQSLVSMLPPLPANARPDVARVTIQGQGVHIELVNSDGAVVAERNLEQNGSCAELAALVAVVIASWESDVHPEFARPHTELVPTFAVVSPPLRAAEPTQIPASSYDLALGGALSFTDSFAAGGTLAGTWIPRGRGPGLRMSATAETQRSFVLGSGRVNWRRWMGSAEVDWRFLRNRMTIDLHGGIGFGLLSAGGTGFFQSQSQLSFSPAATAGARLSWWVARRFSVWLDIAGLYWLRGQSVYSEPPISRQTIPSFQVAASLGLAIGKLLIDR
jgi:hypothetical protein